MMRECWLEQRVEKVLGMMALINISFALTMTCMICDAEEEDGILRWCS